MPVVASSEGMPYESGVRTLDLIGHDNPVLFRDAEEGKLPSDLLSINFAKMKLEMSLEEWDEIRKEDEDLATEDPAADADDLDLFPPLNEHDVFSVVCSTILSKFSANEDVVEQASLLVRDFDLAGPAIGEADMGIITRIVDYAQDPQHKRWPSKAIASQLVQTIKYTLPVYGSARAAGNSEDEILFKSKKDLESYLSTLASVFMETIGSKIESTLRELCKLSDGSSPPQADIRVAATLLCYLQSDDRGDIKSTICALGKFQMPEDGIVNSISKIIRDKKPELTTAATKQQLKRHPSSTPPEKGPVPALPSFLNSLNQSPWPSVHFAPPGTPHRNPAPDLLSRFTSPSINAPATTKDNSTMKMEVDDDSQAQLLRSGGSSQTPSTLSNLVHPAPSIASSTNGPSHSFDPSIGTQGTTMDVAQIAASNVSLPVVAHAPSSISTFRQASNLSFPGDIHPQRHLRIRLSPPRSSSSTSSAPVISSASRGGSLDPAQRPKVSPFPPPLPDQLPSSSENGTIQYRGKKLRGGRGEDSFDFYWWNIKLPQAVTAVDDLILDRNADVGDVLTWYSETKNMAGVYTYLDMGWKEITSDYFTNSGQVLHPRYPQEGDEQRVLTWRGRLDKTPTWVKGKSFKSNKNDIGNIDENDIVVHFSGVGMAGPISSTISARAVKAAGHAGSRGE